MAQIDKAILALKRQPSDFRWETAVKILAHFGYEEDAESGGSHRWFINDELEAAISLPKPHGGSGTQMKRRDQQKLLNHLITWGHIENDQ